MAGSFFAFPFYAFDDVDADVSLFCMLGYERKTVVVRSLMFVDAAFLIPCFSLFSRAFVFNAYC